MDNISNTTEGAGRLKSFFFYLFNHAIIFYHFITSRECFRLFKADGGLHGDTAHLQLKTYGSCQFFKSFIKLLKRFIQMQNNLNKSNFKIYIMVSFSWKQVEYIMTSFIRNTGSDPNHFSFSYFLTVGEESLFYDQRTCNQASFHISVQFPGMTGCSFLVRAFLFFQCNCIVHAQTTTYT